MVAVTWNLLLFILYFMPPLFMWILILLLLLPQHAIIIAAVVAVAVCLCVCVLLDGCQFKAENSLIWLSRY